MPDQDLLLRLHGQKLAHPSQSAAYSEFVDEWSSYISSAKYGFFDECFEAYGYPLRESAINGSDYHRRSQLEEALQRTLSASDDLIVLGNEGSGKTTLVHYVLGYKSYQEFSDSIVRLYFDARNLEGASEPFGKDVLGEVLSQISALKVSNDSLADAFATWCESEALAVPRFRALLEATEGKYSLASLFAFITITLADRRIYVVIDNIDSLSAINLKRVLHFFEAARTRSKQIVRMLERDDLPKVSFIVPCRKTTWGLISNAAAGEFPFRSPKILNIPAIEDGIWEMTKSFIRKRMIRAEDEGRLKKNLLLQIPVADAVSITPDLPLRELLCNIADWIHTHSNETERLISGFSGQSLRRGKMFALKILGNSIIVQNWLSVWLARSKISASRVLSSETITEIVREALFDAMQGIGDGITTTEILLNPFGVIHEATPRRKNPYIGIVLMRLIRRHWDNIHRKTEYSDEIDFEKLLDELVAIGYTEEAIRNCVRSFCVSGVLRPLKLEMKLLLGADQLSTIYQRYYLDIDAFELYWSLVFRTGKHVNSEATSKENSILFMNACTRANYGVGYVSRPASQLYRAFMNVRFLRDCQEGDKILESLIAQKGYKGRIESYVYEVFPSLQKKWRGVLSELHSGVLRSPDESDRDMYHEAIRELEALEDQQRSGGIRQFLAGRT